MRKRNYTGYILGIFFLVVSTNAQAQFLKKLKKQTEEKILKRADEKANELLLKKKSSDQHNEVEKPLSIKGEPLPKEKNQKPEVLKKTTLAKLDDSDVLVYKSPNKAFENVVIQKHNGLPRFGSCNFYVVPNEITARQPEVARAMNEKREKMKTGYPAFLKLAKINLLKDLFKSMDKTALMLENRDLVEEELKSRKAQKLLREFAFLMGTSDTKLEYFCDNPSDSGRCAFASKWGGQRADDFTENEKYVDFISKYFDDILTWSQDFFKDGRQTVYLVHQLTKLSTYDFDHNGFWVSLPHKMRNNFYLDYNGTSEGYFHEFTPESDFGQQMLNKTNQVRYINGKALFKISPEKAEILINNKEKKIQLVSKVTIVFKGLSESNRQLFVPTFKYHFVEPTVEIYEDVQLSKKIGSLDMRQLSYKEN